jgi:hypothetical protein
VSVMRRRMSGDDGGDEGEGQKGEGERWNAHDDGLFGV